MMPITFQPKSKKKPLEKNPLESKKNSLEKNQLEKEPIKSWCSLPANEWINIKTIWQ
jgi:hypothetical protein